MDTTIGTAPLARSFDDFEPYCSWQRDEANDTLIIHLTEFKKNQLKVQINNQGILTISGERPVTDTKCSRFSKQIKLSKICNTSEINAKFVGGLLYVIMPKKMATLDQSNTHVLDQPLKENEKPKPETSKDNLVMKSNIDNLGSKAADNKDVSSHNFRKVTLGRMDKKMVVSFVVAAMVALGAYLSIKYQSKHVAN